MRSEDGATLTSDSKGISHRWAQHYTVLLNGGLAPDHAVLAELPQRPIKHVMDQVPSMSELTECVSTLRKGKSPGCDGIPAEIFKYGGEVLLEEAS